MAASWLEDVETALMRLGGKSDISSIADKVKELRDLSNNKHPKESVRETLARNKKRFKCHYPGEWSVVGLNF